MKLPATPVDKTSSVIALDTIPENTHDNWFYSSTIVETKQNINQQKNKINLVEELGFGGLCLGQLV